jgi:hypothetical protein
MASRFIVITVLLLASFLHAPAAGNNWMSSMNGTLPISQYSITGTHDSGARFDPALAPCTAKCQDLTIAQQLDAGVRFLDIRCRHIDDGFTIHHSEVYQKINFNNVLDACCLIEADTEKDSGWGKRSPESQNCLACFLPAAACPEVSRSKRLCC